MRKPAAHSSFFRRVWKWISRTVFVVILAPFLLIPLYTVVNPPISTVMFFKLFSGHGIHKNWRDLEEISPHLIRAVLVAEDARFCQHRGIDWREVKNAASERGGQPRGASTITMQVVKNLFLWTERSWVRKLIEAPLATYAELFLSKPRILEIYLNIAEMGSGVYGAEAASQKYFGTSAKSLTRAQAAKLAAILPAPLRRNPNALGPVARAHAARIAARANMAGDGAACVF